MQGNNFGAEVEVGKDYNADNDGLSSSCNPCLRLNLAKLASAYQRREELLSVSAAIVQRFYFENIRRDESCPICSSLKNRHELTVCADRIYHTYPSKKVKPIEAKSSWFISKDDYLERRTGKHDADQFSSGTFNRSGNGYWDRGKFLRTDHFVKPSPDFSLINQWLGVCSRDHVSCKPSYSDALDIVSLFDVKTCELVKYPSSKPDYVALSYVWGNTNVNDINLKKLPQVIKDSMVVVKALGKRYLWVDSICIDQRDRQAKMKQIEIMDAIYEGAFATIVDLNSRNADEGLPGMNRQNERIPQLIAEFGSNRLIGKLPSLKAQIKRGKWSERAWTFQEGVLSNRRIIFSQHQVYFVCNEMERNESLDETGPSYLTSLGKPSLPTSEPIARRRIMLISWIINGYIERKLTYDDDALNAISALLQRLTTIACPEGFLYGLPRWNFRHALRWRQALTSLGTDSAQRQLNETTRRQAAHVPTWSWAAWLLPGRIVMFKEEISAQAPPLSILHRGQELVIESTPRTTRTNQSIQQVYCQLPLQDRISGIGKPDHYLLVCGVMLRFSCYIGTALGIRWGSSTPSLAPHIAFPDDLLDIEYMWYNDGNLDNIVPDVGVVAADKSKRIRHDFLLLDARRYEKTTDLILLHLCWDKNQHDVASRGGYLKIYVGNEKSDFFWEHSKPQRSRFWFR